MPLNIIVGLFALLFALVLYSIGTWSAFRAKAFSARTLVILWIGAVFDVLATTMMGMQIGGLDLRPGAPTLHTVLALLAMAGMIVGTAVATWATSAERDEVAALVSRWLLVPWVLWVAVFVWGMMTRGAARMGG
jgi:4-amino-4-deoxy-L-arabinose transferase-like glycosyltransferase